jgi:hypothetical protein
LKQRDYICHKSVVLVLKERKPPDVSPMNLVSYLILELYGQVIKKCVVFRLNDREGILVRVIFHGLLDFLVQLKRDLGLIAELVDNLKLRVQI